MKFRLKHIFIATAAVAALLATCLRIHDVVSTRTVVSVDHANQTRFRIIQEFNAELFNTSIYFDDGDGQWRWYYFDHDDGYWGTGDVEINLDVISVTSKNRSVTIDTKTGRCDVCNTEGINRTYEKSDRIVDLPVPPNDIKNGG